MSSLQSAPQRRFANWIAGLLSVQSSSEEQKHCHAEDQPSDSCKSTRPIEFLHQVQMEPTPENYQLAWEYHFGASARFRQAIDDAMAKSGYLTDAMAQEIIADHLNHWNAVEIANLVAGGNRALHSGSQVIRQSREDSRAYGEALESELDMITQSPEKGSCHYTALVSLTRTMAVKSFEAQRQLDEASETLAGMRNRLADATEQAETDQLTGLPNRWAFEKRFTSALLRAREAMEPLSVAFVDVDHFKKINDNHGHETGDRVLKRIAGALDQLSNNNCHVARHGGEEFVILFLNKNPEDASEIVDQAREELSKHDFKNRATGKQIGQVSFSAGISSLAGDGDGRAMLRRADTALYQAKDSGRNQVAINI